MEWIDKHIVVSPPKRPKKCTGTRFGAILGVNRWKTPFATWCEITRTYEEPFEDTKYTIAGKTIEPKQADYVERSFGMDIIRPTDIYGKDVFKKTYGDFFPENKIFGGMWDYLAKDENGKVDTVLEMKTSKRVEDWNGKIPEYYALQAALYAYLYGVDNVIMVASFLNESDYEQPEKYVPSAKNTILVPFKVSERYPNMKQLVKEATDWWNTYVLTGISPNFDDKLDADILKELRTVSIPPDRSMSSLIQEAETIKAELDENAKQFAAKEKRLKQINEIVKQEGMKHFSPGDKKVIVEGSAYDWTISKSETETVNKEALKADGLYDKYTTKSETYRMTVSERKN